MSGFEFIFSLFGLMLGLSLAEGLGGLTRAIKRRGFGGIGWPTALLGLFVSCDVVCCINLTVKWNSTCFCRSQRSSAVPL